MNKHYVTKQRKLTVADKIMYSKSWGRDFRILIKR